MHRHRVNISSKIGAAFSFPCSPALRGMLSVRPSNRSGAEFKVSRRSAGPTRKRRFPPRPLRDRSGIKVRMFLAPGFGRPLCHSKPTLRGGGAPGAALRLRGSRALWVLFSTRCYTHCPRTWAPGRKHALIAEGDEISTLRSLAFSESTQLSESQTLAHGLLAIPHLRLPKRKGSRTTGATKPASACLAKGTYLRPAKRTFLLSTPPPSCKYPGT